MFIRGIIRYLGFLFILAGTHQLPAQTLRAWLNAGDNAMEKSRYAEAIEYYRKALEFETNEPTISFKMAEASRLYKDYERAAAWYGKIVMDDRENRYPLALFRYAEMKKYLGMYEESCRLYQRYSTAFPNDTAYTGVKAARELADCSAVMELAGRKNEKLKAVEISNAGTPINTIYSEFGASVLGDSILHYSSLRFLYSKTQKKDDQYYVSRILSSSPHPGRNEQPVPLNNIINESGTHNGNSAFSPDYRFMIFSRCTQPEGDYNLQCQLYYSKIENGKFLKAEKISGDINIENYSSTQPAIMNRGAEGYTLIYVSDRPGGYGKLDLWLSNFNSSFQFDSSINAGPLLNTFDEEMSPFFDNNQQVLFFSSYGHLNLGGMDINRSNYINREFTSPENLGPDFNTSVNDVYFTVNRDGQSGTLSSNRPGSMFIKAKTCCYDIYYYRIPEKDSVPTLTSEDSVVAVSDTADPKNEAYYDQFLPLQLYFDNDEPDKRTMAVTTNKVYDRLYHDYMERLVEYKQRYAANLIGEEKNVAEKKIDDFFQNEVTASWNMLNGFCEKVAKALDAGVDIELEVRGRTSPLAENDYNINLSRRRIASLVNYMKQYNNGVLRPWFNDGSLKVVEVPAGETLVQSGISDRLDDLRSSVYNPNAAIERRIELINVNLTPPSP